MEVICTICSKDKVETEGLLPATRRYVSRRIEFVSEESRRLGKPLVIFSGKYGLIDTDAEIPWYNQRLEPEAVAAIVPVLVRQLQAKGVSDLIFYGKPPATPGWEPYYDALEQACHQVNIVIRYRPVDPK